MRSYVHTPITMFALVLSLAAMAGCHSHSAQTQQPTEHYAHQQAEADHAHIDSAYKAASDRLTRKAFALYKAQKHGLSRKEAVRQFKVEEAAANQQLQRDLHGIKALQHSKATVYSPGQDMGIR